MSHQSASLSNCGRGYTRTVRAYISVCVWYWHQHVCVSSVWCVVHYWMGSCYACAPLLFLYHSITLKEVTEGLEEFNERWRNIEYFSSLPISGTGAANHNEDSDSLSGSRGDRVSVTGTHPTVRRRHGRGSTGPKLPGHGRPPPIEGTKGNFSSQDSSQSEWSIGEDLLRTKSLETEYASSEQPRLHHHSSNESASHHVVASQSSLPVPRTLSEDTAVLGWFRSSAPNLQEMPLKFSSNIKKLTMVKSNGIDKEDLPPIVEMSPTPSRSHTSSQNGNDTNRHLLVSSKVRGGSKFASTSALL